MTVLSLALDFMFFFLLQWYRRHLKTMLFLCSKINRKQKNRAQQNCWVECAVYHLRCSLCIRLHVLGVFVFKFGFYFLSSRTFLLTMLSPLSNTIMLIYGSLSCPFFNLNLFFLPRMAWRCVCSCRRLLHDSSGWLVWLSFTVNCKYI